MTPFPLPRLVTVFSSLALTAGLFAQTPPAPQPPAPPRLALPAASPAGSIKQRVGLTDIEITYNRPSLKGREMLGKIEPPGFPIAPRGGDGVFEMGSQSCR